MFKEINADARIDFDRGLRDCAARAPRAHQLCRRGRCRSRPCGPAEGTGVGSDHGVTAYQAPTSPHSLTGSSSKSTARTTMKHAMRCGTHTSRTPTFRVLRVEAWMVERHISVVLA